MEDSSQTRMQLGFAHRVVGSGLLKLEGTRETTLPRFPSDRWAH